VVLRDESHAGRTYELTGPAPISPREQAQAIGDALGTTVHFIEQSRDEARAQLLQRMPGPVADSTLAVLSAPLAAEQRVSPAVEQILGRARHLRRVGGAQYRGVQVTSQSCADSSGRRPRTAPRGPALGVLRARRAASSALPGGRPRARLAC
jgi:hypothetical protein